MKNIPRIVLTPGEPAGVGPELCIALAQRSWPAELILVADRDLLAERAAQLRLPIAIEAYDRGGPRVPSFAGTLRVFHVPLRESVIAGRLNTANAPYVIDTLRVAAEKCLSRECDALVTGPVHKGIINDAGIAFTGHTEFLADLTRASQVVMMLVARELRVALVTTHLPLKDVGSAVTAPRLESVIRVLHGDLVKYFGIPQPRILVCGLNPHAGENGHLGREELDVIAPVLERLRTEGFRLRGPLAADTLFTPKNLADADAVLAMYHDQGLPVLKYAGFGQAVNITLGLPIIRTSVDHGTALELAGTGRAEVGSLEAALQLAATLASCGE